MGPGEVTFNRSENTSVGSKSLHADFYFGKWV